MNILTFIAPGIDEDLAAYLSGRLAKETNIICIEGEKAQVTEARSLGVEAWSDLAKVALAAPTPFDAIIVGGTGRSMSLRETFEALAAITAGLPLTTCAAFVQGGRDEEQLRLVNGGFSHIISTTAHYMTLAVALREDQLRLNRIAKMFRDNAQSILPPPLPHEPQASDFGPKQTSARQPMRGKGQGNILPVVTYDGVKLDIPVGALYDLMVVLMKNKGQAVDLSKALQEHCGRKIAAESIRIYVTSLRKLIKGQTTLSDVGIRSLIYKQRKSPTVFLFDDKDDAFKLVNVEEAINYQDEPQEPTEPNAANTAYVSFKGARLNILEAHLNDALCLLVEAKSGPVDLLDQLTSRKGWPLKGTTLTTYMAQLKATICRRTGLSRKDANALIYNPPGTSPTTYALHNEDGAFVIHNICAPTATAAPTPQP